MNSIKTFFLMIILALLLMFLGGLVGGQRGIIIAFIFALIMNFFSYWFSDKMVLSMYHARKIEEKDDPRIYKIVRQLAYNANLPMPKIYIIPMQQPNAFATGRDPHHSAVAISEGLLKILTEDEIAGVLSHELSHIKHRDILLQTIVATFATAISFLAYMARWGAILGGGRDDDNRGGIIGLLIMSIIAPIAAMLIQLSISRAREYMADETGAYISGTPLSLANALRKLSYASRKIPISPTPTHNATAHMFIVKPFSGKGLSALFSTHPPIEERIKRLEKLATKIS